MAAMGLPTLAHADTRLLVEYDGDAHTAVKVFTVPARGVSRETEAPNSTGQKPNNLNLPKDHILVSWESSAGTSSVMVPDPRIIRAPMRRNGIGHEAILVQEKGTYLLTIKSDDINLDTLKLTFPGNPTLTKLKVPSNIGK